MSKHSIVFMFSGQGSQHFQMGRALFQNEAVFRESMMQMDLWALKELDCSLIDIIYTKDKSQIFNDALFTNPAIFAVEYSLARVLIAAGVTPDLVLGVSIGSFVASVIAGGLEVREAFTAVIEQARIFQKSCEPGCMIAVLGTADEALIPYSRCELAASDFADHKVFATPLREVDFVEQSLRQQGLIVQRLPVSYAYHSRWIDPARSEIERQLKMLSVNALTIPLICCQRSEQVREISPEYFWEVVRGPIRFAETVRRLDSANESYYVDVGPAGTLAGLLKYILPAQSNSKACGIMTPFDRDLQNLNQVTSMLTRRQLRASSS